MGGVVWAMSESLNYLHTEGKKSTGLKDPYPLRRDSQSLARLFTQAVGLRQMDTGAPGGLEAGGVKGVGDGSGEPM